MLGFFLVQFHVQCLPFQKRHTDFVVFRHFKMLCFTQFSHVVDFVIIIIFFLN